MSADQQKRLRLMTYWLFGSVVIVWAAVFAWAYYITAPYGGTWDIVLGNVWPIFAIVLVAAAAIYVGYRYWYLARAAGA